MKPGRRWPGIGGPHHLRQLPSHPLPPILDRVEATFSLVPPPRKEDVSLLARMLSSGARSWGAPAPAGSMFSFSTALPVRCPSGSARLVGLSASGNFADLRIIYARYNPDVMRAIRQLLADGDLCKAPNSNEKGDNYLPLHDDTLHLDVDFREEIFTRQLDILAKGIEGVERHLRRLIAPRRFAYGDQSLPSFDICVRLSLLELCVDLPVHSSFNAMDVKAAVAKLFPAITMYERDRCEGFAAGMGHRGRDFKVYNKHDQVRFEVAYNADAIGSRGRPDPAGNNPYCTGAVVEPTGGRMIAPPYDQHLRRVILPRRAEAQKLIHRVITDYVRPPSEVYETDHLAPIPRVARGCQQAARDLLSKLTGGPVKSVDLSPRERRRAYRLAEKTGFIEHQDRGYWTLSAAGRAYLNS